MISLLSVDPEKTLPAATTAALEKTGEFSVTPCPDAGHALEMIRQRPFDAILASLPVPGPDGLAFLTAVRSQQVPTPFLILTNAGGEELVIAALNQGADQFLKAGTGIADRPGELAEVIRQMIRLHDERARNYRPALITRESPHPIIEVNARREVLYANPAAMQALSAQGLPPNPAAFLPEDFDAIVPSLKAAGSNAVYRQVRVGSAFYGAILLKCETDNTIRIYSRDITERVFHTSALEQSIRKLNLLASIARHDIKNKLTGVLGYLELTKGSTNDPTLVDYLKRVETSAVAIQHQIEFTKKYQNLGVNPPTWHDVSLLVDEAKKQSVPGKVIIENSTAGLQVYADPLLDKILVNLMHNALEYGEHLTRIRVHGTVTPTGYRLIFEDDGIGIKPEMKERAFSKIVGRSEPLGLFLSREILGITGITLDEKGEYGKGARFEMMIPPGKYRLSH